MDKELIILLISTGFIGVGIFFWQKGSYLLSNGKKANAIIFKNNYREDRSGGMHFPVVRFLTDKQEWITQELNVGYSWKKEEGTKLEVLYDPDDPTYVEINSSFHLEVLPRLLVAVGMAGFVSGVLFYLEVF